MERFDTSNDPRFRKVPRNVRRVEVDRRFAHMFQDKSFVETPKVDATGRKLKRDAGRLKLREFYALAEEKPPANLVGGRAGPKEAVTSRGAAPKAKRKGTQAGEEKEEDEDLGSEADDEDVDDEDDEEEDGEDEEEEEEDAGQAEAETAVWAQNEASIPRGDATRRLAVMGCDWDHVTAGDLMVMFRTYLASKEAQKGAHSLRGGGVVERVTIYPSDFGLEQIAKEALAGPTLEAAAPAPKKAPAKLGEEEEEAENAAQREALRLYQLTRAKYYWALVECDSVATAAWLYDQMDGIEADGICLGTLDLRFAPDDLEPPHAPKEVATEIPRKYQAPAMLQSAIGHTKVKCTWDEAPLQRKKDLMRKKFSPQEMMDMDLEAYLASSSGEEGEKSGAEALRKLARGGGEGDDSDFFASGSDDGGEGKGKNKGGEVEGDMEATFNLKAVRLEEELQQRASQKGGKQVHTLEANEPKSVWEQYLDKKKRTRKERKEKARADKAALKTGAAAEGAAEDAGGRKGKPRRTARFGEGPGDGEAADLELLAGDGAEDDRGFNARGPQRRAHRGDVDRRKKRKGGAGDGVGDGEEGGAEEAPAGGLRVNVDDPRIAQIFSNADFELDPTNPEFRRTEFMGALLRKKRQRKVAAAGAEPASGGQAASAPSAPGAAAPSPSPPQGAAAARPEGQPPPAAGAGGIQLFGRAARAAADRGAAGGGAAAAAATGGGPPSADGAAAAPRRKRKLPRP